MCNRALNRLVVVIVFAVTVGFTGYGRTYEIKILEASKTKVRYGVLSPLPKKRPAPTLLIFATSIEETLASDSDTPHPYFMQSGAFLREKGYVCVSVDLPCHGNDQRGTKRQGLAAWPELVIGRPSVGGTDDQLASWKALVDAPGSDNPLFIADFCAKTQSVLDDLIRRRISDRKRIAVCGISRGGFLAAHFAAYEPRVKAVAMFSPVTALSALKEFRGVAASNPGLVEIMSLTYPHFANKLSGRPVWMAIGHHDARVGTDKTIEFSQLLSAATKARRVPAKHQLHLLPEPRGHSAPAGTFEQAARWIDEQL